MIKILFCIPTDTWYIVIGVMMGVIYALHILSGIMNGIIAKTGQFVNLGLHIVLFSVLIIAQINIEVAVLLYTSSVFVCTSVRYLKYETEKRKTSAIQTKEEEGI